LETKKIGKTMRIQIVTLFILLIGLNVSVTSFAQSPQGKTFGFGIILGEPTGLTFKFWQNPINAVVVDVGSGGFGKPRIGGDYLWHFDAFNSAMVKLFAGPGAAIGFGSGRSVFWKEGKHIYVRDDNQIGIGVRGVFGVNVIPQNTPLEIFFEIGALIAVIPDFTSTADVALGMRFYP
jgi:hypothetical protein